jgi:hypothetical protein
MGPTEKKIAVLLVVVLIAMVAVYVSTGNRPQQGQAMAGRMAGRGGPGAAGATAAAQPGGAACPTGAPAAAGGAAKTEELGKSGAKLEIIAVVPVAHGCHATSIAELKKAYQSHPNDIHLTIVDLQGPDAAEYAKKVGASYTRITINGKYQFETSGRRVALEQAEGRSYRPADLIPVIETELKAK